MLYYSCALQISEKSLRYKREWLIIAVYWLSRRIELGNGSAWSDIQPQLARDVGKAKGFCLVARQEQPVINSLLYDLIQCCNLK